MKSRDMTRILIHEAIAALTDTTNTKLVSVNLEKISFGVFMFMFQNSLMFNPLKKKIKKNNTISIVPSFFWMEEFPLYNSAACCCHW